MAKTSNLNIQIDTDLMHDTEALYDELGLDLSTAIRIFMKKSLIEGGLPFELKEDYPNEEAIETMLEAKRIANDPNVKKYDNIEEALAELKR